MCIQHTKYSLEQKRCEDNATMTKALCLYFAIIV